MWLEISDLNKERVNVEWFETREFGLSDQPLSDVISYGGPSKALRSP